jgi:hypothetical protein
MEIWYYICLSIFLLFIIGVIAWLVMDMIKDNKQKLK